MSDTVKKDGADEELSPEEMRTLGTWPVADPPNDFTAQVMATMRTQKDAPTTHPPAVRTTTVPVLTRAERERRQRRRAAMGAAMGALAVSASGGFVAWQVAATLQVATATHAVMAVYLAALAFGGVLLLASLVGTHGHADADGGAGGDLEHGGPDTHAHPYDRRELDIDHAIPASFVLPFLSLRFWIFGLTFFGLTGAVIQWLSLAGPITAAVAASALGLALGYGAAHVFQSLARGTVGDISSDGGMIGREGTLLLPAAKGQRGKMRIVAHNVSTDLIVETDDERTLAAGSTVIIIGMRGAVALVERSPTPNGSVE